MPYTDVRTNSTAAKRNHTLSTRSVGQNINHSPIQGPLLSSLSSIPEERQFRFIIFTLLALDQDANWKLAPFLPPIQRADTRDHLTSGAASPEIFFWFGQPNENNIDMVGQIDSVNSVSCCSSRGSVLLQPRNGKKFSNSNETTYLPCSLVPDESPKLATDGLAIDFIADTLPKADKTRKQSPRRKGKKKGKHCKGAMQKKIESALGITYGDIVDAASPLEITEINSSSNKVSEASSSSGSLVKEDPLDKDEGDTNNEYVGCSTALLSSTSCRTVQLGDIHEDSSASYVDTACWSKDIFDSDSNERVQCSSEACSSNGSRPVITGKKGRRYTKLSSYGSLNGTCRVVSASTHNRNGKDNKFSVWQKVEKLDNEESVGRSRHVNATMHKDKTASEEPKRNTGSNPSRQMKNQSGKPSKEPGSDDSMLTKSTKLEDGTVRACGVFSKSTDRMQMKAVNQKMRSAPKQTIQQSKHYTAKSNSSKASEHHSLHKEELTILRPTADNNCATFPAKDVGDSQSQQNQSFQTDIIKATPAVCSIGWDSNTQNASKEVSSLTRKQSSHCDSAVKSKHVYISSEICGNVSRDNSFAEVEDNQPSKLEVGGTLEGASMLDSSAGHVLQKWVPVGRKELSNLDSLKACGAKPSVQESCSTDIVKVGDLQNTPDSISSTGILRSTWVDNSSPKDDKLENGGESQLQLAEKFDDVLVVPKHQEVLKVRASRKSASDLEKMIKAVKGGYRTQKAVGDIQQVNGGPLADIERFVYSVSPVLGDSACITSCCCCSHEEPGDNFLCSHQIPDISLKSIWQWYEEPSCYGVEVKAQGWHKSTRLWNCRSDFTAYFVPYLSAVQLFGRSKSTTLCNNTEEGAAVDKSSRQSSYMSSIPIFSMLLPQPCNQRKTMRSSFPAKDDQFSGTDDGELIFEYFESEQPPWRRPLFEKIKELVSGVKPSASQISGDPQKLENLNLRDLHPASWYSVAWYPIYRIPDGNFHAAFLTFHSLGHLVRQSSSSNMDSLAHTVSPVVGLQSYNDKGEWWFQMHDSSDSFASIEVPCSSPSEILKERRRNLNQTALVMARANVPKGDGISQNSHPDFEFFLSRNR